MSTPIYRYASMALLCVVILLAYNVVAGMADAPPILEWGECIHAVSEWGEYLLLCDRETGLLCYINPTDLTCQRELSLPPYVDDIAVHDGILYAVPEGGTSISRFDLESAATYPQIQLPVWLVQDYDIVGLAVEETEITLLCTARSWSGETRLPECGQRLVTYDFRTGATSVSDGSFASEGVGLELKEGNLFTLVFPEEDVCRLMVRDGVLQRECVWSLTDSFSSGVPCELRGLHLGGEYVYVSTCEAHRCGATAAVYRIEYPEDWEAAWNGDSQ